MSAFDPPQAANFEHRLAANLDFLVIASLRSFLFYKNANGIKYA